MPLPSKISFASFLQYSPRGTSPTSAQSRTITHAIKNDSFATTQKGVQRIIPYTAKRVAEMRSSYPSLENCFSGEVIGVPVPKSAPLVEGGLWSATRLCQALLAEGVISNVLPLLVRTSAVTKSATAAPGRRPTAESHFETLAVQAERPLLPAEAKFVLIDDVVTRGATLLASFARLHEAYPKSRIECFAFVRTMSGSDVDSVVDPVAGVITNNLGYLHREP